MSSEHDAWNYVDKRCKHGRLVRDICSQCSKDKRDLSSNPTDTQQLEAIGTVCTREGIHAVADNPAPTLNQVNELIQRLYRSERIAGELRSEFDRARTTCYGLNLQIRELEQLARLGEQNTEAESEQAA